MEILNPKIDIIFKKIFGVEENKDLTISLINSIVSDNDKVEDIQILNPYNQQSFRNDKLSILDIKAKGCNGKYFNIEIQVSDEADYDKRALYYWGKLYTEQMKKGDPYNILQKTIGIHLLWFNSIPNCDNYHNAFVLKEKLTNVEYFTDIELHTVELQKIANDLQGELKTFAKQIKTNLDRWSAFLTKQEIFNAEGLPTELNTPEINKAIDIVNIMHLSKGEKEAYESRIKWLQMEASAIEKSYNKGVAEEKKATIILMLEDNLDKNTIAKYARVDISVVEAIIAQIK